MQTFTCYARHLDFRTEATDFLPQSLPNAQRGRAGNMQLLFIRKSCNFKLAIFMVAPCINNIKYFIVQLTHLII